jgi:hypothetical protein
MSERVWEELSRTLRTSAPYRALLGGRAEVVRLPVPAAAWVGGLLARDLRRPLVAVVPREADALTWMEAARLFSGVAGIGGVAGVGGFGGVGGEQAAVYFPSPSLTPYQEAEVSLQVRAQEAVALDCVLSGTATAVVTTPRALYRRLPRPQAFAAAALTLRAGEEHPLERLTAHLARHGFRRTDLVYEVGDFAVRGGILDLFPPGEEAPIRIDLFGDTVESIRWFDPQSQRSEDTLESSPAAPRRRGAWPASCWPRSPTSDPKGPSCSSACAAPARSRAGRTTCRCSPTASLCSRRCPTRCCSQWTRRRSRPRRSTTPSGWLPTSRRAATPAAWRRRQRPSSSRPPRCARRSRRRPWC